MSDPLFPFVMEEGRRFPHTSGPSLPLSVAGNEKARNRGELLLSALGYVSFLGVLPLLLAPKSPFCRFHGRQGLIYNIVFTLARIVAVGLAFALPDITHFPVVVTVLHILIVSYCIIRTLLGHTFRLPYISGVAREFPF